MEYYFKLYAFRIAFIWNSTGTLRLYGTVHYMEQHGSIACISAAFVENIKDWSSFNYAPVIHYYGELG